MHGLFMTALETIEEAMTFLRQVGHHIGLPVNLRFGCDSFLAMTPDLKKYVIQWVSESHKRANEFVL